jgi:hypothetical protein
MQPPHTKTLEKLIREIDEAIDRDRQFIVRSDELRSKWKILARRINSRVDAVLRMEKPSRSISSL